VAGTSGVGQLDRSRSSQGKIIDPLVLPTVSIGTGDTTLAAGAS
jgi:hypothetical protein